LAAKAGHLEMIQVLLELGADPTYKNSSNKTAAHFSKDHGMQSFFKIVLS
jgi:ankyrin repeat protein